MSAQLQADASVRLRRAVRQVHRWLGLLIGIQVLLWVTGGVVMSVLRLDEVRGDHLAAKRVLPVLSAEHPVLAPAELLGRYAERAPDTVVLTTLLDRPVYRITGDGKTWLVDARDGTALSPLPQPMAEAIARADYTGDAPLLGTDWVTEEAVETRGRHPPLWRARFGDSVNTAVYVSPDTGAVVARRNDLWRLFDFVWMLHIMDYQEREDFNHPLLIATAATALLFVFSGLAMLVLSFRPRR